MPLTPTEATTLSLAARQFLHESSRERAVRAELDVNMPTFWRRVNVLLGSEAALAHDPLAVRRLRRVRDDRLRVRV